MVVIAHGKVEKSTSRGGLIGVAERQIVGCMSKSSVGGWSLHCKDKMPKI